MRIEIARENHARMIATTMRARDIAEVTDGWGKDPEPAMLECLRESYYARTMLHELEPLCMWGLAPMIMLSGVARFWIFASAAVDRHPVAFARATMRARRELFSYCSIATNLIDINDSAAMRWMAWLGGEALLPLQRKGGRVFGQFVIHAPRKGARQCLQA